MTEHYCPCCLRLGEYRPKPPGVCPHCNKEIRPPFSYHERGDCEEAARLEQLEEEKAHVHKQSADNGPSRL